MRRAKRLGQQQNRGNQSRNPALPSMTVLLERRLHHEVVGRVTCSELFDLYQTMLFDFRWSSGVAPSRPSPAVASSLFGWENS